jgi:hypothetical protein
MELGQAFNTSTIWTIAGGSVIAYLAGTIAKDRFGLNAKTVGFVFAMLWAAAWAVAQFYAPAAGPLATVMAALITGLLVYALAFMEADVLSKIAELMAKRQAGEQPGIDAQAVASVSRETRPADSGSYTYEPAPPTTAERLAW